MNHIILAQGQPQVRFHSKRVVTTKQSDISSGNELYREQIHLELLKAIYRNFVVHFPHRVQYTATSQDIFRRPELRGKT